MSPQQSEITLTYGVCEGSAVFLQPLKNATPTAEKAYSVYPPLQLSLLSFTLSLSGVQCEPTWGVAPLPVL